MKPNRITKDGTAADSDIQPIVTTSADIEANPMLPAVPSYKISKKKVEQLYSAVHEEIMQVRIAVDKLSNKELSDQIDNILGRLCFEAPQKAIDVFKA